MTLISFSALAKKYFFFIFATNILSMAARDTSFYACRLTFISGKILTPLMLLASPGDLNFLQLLPMSASVYMHGANDVYQKTVSQGPQRLVVSRYSWFCYRTPCNNTSSCSQHSISGSPEPHRD